MKTSIDMKQRGKAPDTVTLGSDEDEGKTWQEIFRQFKPKITDEEIDYILWEETCYPFDDRITLNQIKNYFNEQRTKQ